MAGLAPARSGVLLLICAIWRRSKISMMGYRAGPGLYDPRNEHDSCGVGFVVNIKGRKSHDIIRRGLEILVNLDHRGAVGADALLRHWAEERGLVLPPPGGYAVAMCFLPREE